MDKKPSFLKNHADTLAIIGVNIAIAAMLLTLIILNSSRIDAATCRVDAMNAKSDAIFQSTTSRIDAMNARSDALYNIVYDMLKEGKSK